MLGGEQSGHIDAVGFEMYMKLLEETVRELKGEELEDDVRATRQSAESICEIDERYVPDMNQRLMLYRKVAAARQRGRDRPGAVRGGRSLRPAARLGAESGRLRAHSGHGRQARRRSDRPGGTDGRHKVQAAGQAGSGAGWCRWCRQRTDMTLVPPSALKLNLERRRDRPTSRHRRAGAAAT